MALLLKGIASALSLQHTWHRWKKTRAWCGAVSAQTSQSQERQEMEVEGWVGFSEWDMLRARHGPLGWEISRSGQLFGRTMGSPLGAESS